MNAHERSTDVIERLARVEERVGLTIEKLAEFVSDTSDKLDDTFEKVVGVESMLKLAKIQDIQQVFNRVDILWEARQSVWRILSPVISSLMSATIVGVISWIIATKINGP